MRRGAVAAVVLAGLAAVGWWTLRVERPIWIFELNILNYDGFDYYYPTFQYAFGRLGRGEFPWWNPYQLCGTPFFATAQHLLLYPLNAFYLVLPTPAAMKGTAILHLALAVVFTFVLGRVLALSWIASLTAGLAFAFSGSVISLVYTAHHLYGAVWMPLVLATAHLVWTGARRLPWIVALATAFACQYLGGYPMYCTFSIYLVAGYVAWRLACGLLDRTPVRLLVSRTAAVAAAGGLALVLSAPQLLPALELARMSPRRPGGLSLEGADPPALAAQFAPASMLRALLPVHDSGFPPLCYVGVVVLALACLAPLNRPRRREAVFFGLAAVLGWLMAFGAHTPVYRVFFHLPMASWFRLPARFLVLASLALAMLGGIGADLLSRAAEARRPAWALVTALVALAVGLLVADPSLLLARPLGLHLGVLTGWLVALQLVWAGAGRSALLAMLPLLVYAELFAAFTNVVVIPETHPHFHDLPGRVVEYLQQHQAHDRTYIVTARGDLAHPDGLPLKAGMTNRLFTIADRENVYASRYEAYVARMEGRTPSAEARPPQGEVRVTAHSPNLRLLDLLGVRFIVEGRGGAFRDGVNSERFPVLLEDEGLRVLGNRAALPRTFIAREVEVVTDPGRVLDRLADPAFNPLATVLLEEEPPPGPASSGAGSPSTATTEITTYEPETVVVRTESSEPGFLVLTDQYYPGWTAEVDGVPQPIHRADYLFRAVAVPAGRHEVVFRYRPSLLRTLRALVTGAPATSGR